MTRRGFEARIVSKAWRDPQYKARLLQDPKGVLEEEVQAIDPSVTLLDALNVDVHEEGPDTYHLVLPRNPNEISLGEVVPDENLEAVAPQTIAVVVAGVLVVAGVGVAAVNSAAAVNAAANVNVAVNATSTSG